MRSSRRRPPSEVVEAIKLGLDQGVNHFDNADIYGNGRAERMLSNALIRLGVKSDSVVIATKVGHFLGTAAHAYEPAHIRHQCEQSLVNLKRGYIDIYYFHHGDFGSDDQYLPGAIETVNTLQKEGKIRAVGLSAYSADHFLKLTPQIKPAVLQSWAHIIDPQFVTPGSKVSRLMDQMNLHFVAFSPLAQGLLLGKYSSTSAPTFEPGDHRQQSSQFKTESLRDLEPKIEQLKARFGTTAVDLASTSLNYLLAQPRVASVIPGFRNATQAKCNLGAIGKKLTPEDIVFIDNVFGRA